MNTKYLSTFLSGTSPLVKSALEKSIISPKILLELDGLVAYETAVEPGKLLNFKFLNNSFILVKQFSNADENCFKIMFSWAEENGFSGARDTLKNFNFKNFRVIISDANQLVSYDRKSIVKIEKRVKQDLGLNVNRLNPDTEVWFLRRSEGYCFLLIRLTNNSKVEHRSRGQLRPELANLMCLFASLASSDVILDPFAGHGTIVDQLQGFPHSKILAYEQDLDESALVIKKDFFENDIPSEFVTKIITDPPWGLFDLNVNIEELYSKMFSEFERLLTKNGEIVILLSRDYDLNSLLEKHSFVIKSFFEILVSGKKATLYKLVKR